MRRVHAVPALAAAVLTVGLLALPAAPGSASPRTRPVHPHAAAPPDRSVIFVVGYSHRYGIIYDDFGNGRILAVRPDGSHARVLHTDAQAVAVAGDVIEYFRPSDFNADVPDHFLDLAKHVHGLVPHRWMALAPGGGVRVAKHRDGWHAYFDSDTGPERDLGVMTDLPNVRPLYFDLVASRYGLAVFATRANGRPAGIEYYPSAHRPFHRPLRLTGLPRDLLPDCHHLGTALSCLDGDGQDKAIGIDRTGRHRASLRHPSLPVGDAIFVRDRVRRFALTTFDTVQGEADEPSCPCTVRFDNGARIHGLTWETLAANNARDPSVFFVEQTAAGPAIFRSHYGRGPARLVRLAPLQSG